MTEENKQPEPQAPVLNMVERAEAAVKAMQEQNDRAEVIAKRNEEASAMIRLGGGTNSGQPQEKPENPAEKMAKEIVSAFKM